MIPALFLGFVAALAALLVALVARSFSGRNAALFASALGAWLIYVGVLSSLGVIQNTTMRPPGIAFVFVPVVAFLVGFIWRMRSPSGVRPALAFPLWMLLGAQCFRVLVELFLHQLWRDGLIPKMLTFEGANVDIYIGATAPLVAWLATRGHRRLALLWNVLGLLALANVVVRAVLSAPGPLNFIHAEVPNLMIGTFPYTFLPGFLVPLAVILHVLALRALTVRARTSLDTP